MKITERVHYLMRDISFAILVAMIPSISLCQAENPYSGVSGNTVAEQQDYAFAVGLYRDGQYELALKQFRSYLRSFPHSTRTDEITFLSGECLVQIKMYDSALIEYKKVMDSYSSSNYFTRSELRVGEIYVQLEEFDRAEALLKRVLSLQGNDDLKGEASYEARANVHRRRKL